MDIVSDITRRQSFSKLPKGDLHGQGLNHQHLNNKRRCKSEHLCCHAMGDLFLVRCTLELYVSLNMYAPHNSTSG